MTRLQITNPFLIDPWEDWDGTPLAEPTECQWCGYDTSEPKITMAGHGCIGPCCYALALEMDRVMEKE